MDCVVKRVLYVIFFDEKVSQTFSAYKEETETQNERIGPVKDRNVNLSAISATTTKNMPYGILSHTRGKVSSSSRVGESSTGWARPLSAGISVPAPMLEDLAAFLME